jgi:hypothetical protein
MSTATSRSQVTIRLDPDLLARISAAAAEDRRPLSAYVRNLILDAVGGDRDREVEHAGGRRNGY